MTKKYIYIIAILLIILIALFIVYKKVNFEPRQEIQPTDLIASQEKNTATTEQKISLSINFGEGTVKETIIELKDGMTALDALKSGLQTLEINLKIKDSSMGAYIESIGDSQGGQDGKYWMNYLNGTLTSTSADKTILKPGDRVEWKFEKPAF